MNDDKLENIIRGWSKDRAVYFEELKTFLEKHKDAQMIEYSNDYRCPTKAYYVFQPYQVEVERQLLMQRIASENAKLAEVEEEMSDE